MLKKIFFDIMSNNTQREKMNSLKDQKQIYELFCANGYTKSLDEFKKDIDIFLNSEDFRQLMNDNCEELSDEMLELVAGGINVKQAITAGVATLLTFCSIGAIGNSLLSQNNTNTTSISAPSDPNFSTNNANNQHDNQNKYKNNNNNGGPSNEKTDKKQHNNNTNKTTSRSNQKNINKTLTHKTNFNRGTPSKNNKQKQTINENNMNQNIIEISDNNKNDVQSNPIILEQAKLENNENNLPPNPIILEKEQQKLEQEKEQQKLEQEKEQQKLEQQKLEQQKLEQQKLEQEKEQQKLEKEKEQQKLEQQKLEKEKQEKLKQQEKLEKERLEKEKLEKERLEKERLEKERLEKERLELEKLEKEKQEKLKQQEKLEKEKLEKEKLEKERLELEKLEKEKLEKERLELEKLEKEKQEKLKQQEKLEKERLEKERLEKERLELEKKEKEKLEKEKEQQKLEQQKLEKEKLEKEKEQQKLEQQKLEKEKKEKEKLEKEKLEKEKLEKEKEQQKLEQQKLEQQKLEKEKKEKEKLEKEKQEKEKKEKEKKEKEKKEKEKKEKEKKEKEKKEKEKLEKEKLEKEKLEKEKLEKEKLEKEKLEKEKLEKEKQEKEKLEKEKQEKEKQEKEKLEKETEHRLLELENLKKDIQNPNKHLEQQMRQKLLQQTEQQLSKLQNLKKDIQNLNTQQINKAIEEALNFQNQKKGLINWLDTTYKSTKEFDKLIQKKIITDIIITPYQNQINRLNNYIKNYEFMIKQYPNTDYYKNLITKNNQQINAMKNFTDNIKNNYQDSILNTLKTCNGNNLEYTLMSIFNNAGFVSLNNSTPFLLANSVIKPWNEAALEHFCSNLTKDKNADLNTKIQSIINVAPHLKHYGNATFFNLTSEQLSEKNKQFLDNISNNVIIDAIIGITFIDQDQSTDFNKFFEMLKSDIKISFGSTTFFEEATQKIGSLLDRLQKKNCLTTDLNQLKLEYQDIHAGAQSSHNCGMFAEQSLLNYFNKYQFNQKHKIISKNNNASTAPFNLGNNQVNIDVVEQAFLERNPLEQHLVQTGQFSSLDIAQHLLKEGIFVRNFQAKESVKNNSKEHLDLRVKMAKAMLIEHFSKSTIPVIANVGDHWINIMGIDPKNDQVLTMNSASTKDNTKPIIETFSSLCSNIAHNTTKNHSEYCISLLFARPINQNEDVSNLETSFLPTGFKTTLAQSTLSGWEIFEKHTLPEITSEKIEQSDYTVKKQ